MEKFLSLETYKPLKIAHVHLLMFRRGRGNNEINLKFINKHAVILIMSL
jgi:hypothetical protein